MFNFHDFCFHRDSLRQTLLLLLLHQPIPYHHHHPQWSRLTRYCEENGVIENQNRIVGPSTNNKNSCVKKHHVPMNFFFNLFNLPAVIFNRINLKYHRKVS